MMRRQLRLAVFVLMATVPVGRLAAAPPDAANQPPKGAAQYQAEPRPADGRNMALTVGKLENGFDPPRPLLIWAIGSSFTNGLGNGELLQELVRARFPHAPPIEYRKIAGNSTSYHFSHGWARHLVIPDQPDVVLLYNFGKTEDLERMIVELRRNTTADIIVGTLHWCAPHQSVWPDADARNSHQDPVALRAMCEEYGVELVENRREMTAYMLEHGLGIADLLADAVHENRYAARMTVMNIARHFHPASPFAYDPGTRERRLEAGASLTVRFNGNRINLVGRRGPQGGTAAVRIDGRPAGEVEAFYATYIEPDPKNAPAPPNPPRDRAPHAVSLGRNLVPQKWTLTLTSDQGDYELVGSVTGADGVGNAKQPFTSSSGQIVVEPEFWRDPQNNRRGDTFRFEVLRATAATVDFKAQSEEKFRLRLAAFLANGPHTLELVPQGDGAVTVDAFEVFEPPLSATSEN